MKRIYAADFETNTSLEGCKKNPVWAWGIKHIYKSDSSYKFGNSIESFFDYLRTIPNNSVVYFHNEKFDGQFILYYICKNGYVRTNKKIENSYDCTIDDMLKFYDITIRILNNKGKLIEIHIRDSLKKINMPIQKMPGAFGLDIEKGNLDDHEEESYDTYREPGHILTDFEQDYLKRDVLILSKALRITYDKGLTSMTMAMDAMSKFKEMIGKNVFDYYFPTISIEEDKFVRKSYKGGWTFSLKHQLVKYGRVYDVNSLYPSVLYSVINGEKHIYPKFEGVYYEGKYNENNKELYPLYVQHFYCSFKCKPNKLPFIQLKTNYLNTRPQYEYDSGGIVELYLTNVDMELFFETYDLTSTIEYIDGYMYQGVMGIFDDYIDYWLEQKVKAKKEGNKAMYTISKVYLNSLYGKFGTSKTVSGKVPYYDEESNSIKYRDEIYLGEDGKEYDTAFRDGYYLPVATFCTSYARGVTLRAANKAYEQGRFCYADTDSIHITGDYELEGLHVDSNKLGWWDHEKTFSFAKFIRAKTYAEFNGKWDIKCAGMPQQIKDAIAKKENFLDLFDVGFSTHKKDNKGNYITDEEGNYIRLDDSIPGKLQPKVVPGGCILTERPFQITKD